MEGRIPLHNGRQGDFRNFRRYLRIPNAGHAKELIYASAPHILYPLSWTLVSWKKITLRHAQALSERTVALNILILKDFRVFRGFPLPKGSLAGGCFGIC